MIILLYFQAYHQQWRGATGRKLNDPTHIYKLDLRKKDESECALTIDATVIGDNICPNPKVIDEKTRQNMFDLAAAWGFIKPGKNIDGI